MTKAKLARSISQRGANRALGRLGLSLVRADRGTTEGFLARAARAGIRLSTVVDVGAAFGDWSLSCSRWFPEARYLLVEPVAEYLPFLEQATERLASAEIVAAAAGEKNGMLDLQVHSDLVGTSQFAEAGEELAVDVRSVDMVTLDSLIETRELSGPYLLKIDVQGAELRVLEGAKRLAEAAALVVLEVSFFPFFVGGAAFEEVVAAIRAAGLSVANITNPLYRPIDDSLAQADLCCVPTASALRATVAFATPEQRAVADRRFRLALEWRRRKLIR